MYMICLLYNTLYVIHYISTFRIPSLTFINSRVHPPFSESNPSTRVIWVLAICIYKYIYTHINRAQFVEIGLWSTSVQVSRSTKYVQLKEILISLFFPLQLPRLFLFTTSLSNPPSQAVGHFPHPSAAF